MEPTLIYKMLIVSASLIVGVGSWVFFKKEDNPVEELAEEIIKQETGLDIDLSPQSPEKDVDGNTK